ncbi:hypothetical protein N9M16_01740 [Candidatus Dependentiae bacterium]|nr:hypothetical protein [Candidatus Dependentiae bacterium]
MLIAVRARLLAYRCAHFTNGSKSPKVTIIFVPPFRKHIGANVTEIARKASTEGGVSFGILVPAILTLNQQGKKKPRKESAKFVDADGSPGMLSSTRLACGAADTMNLELKIPRSPLFFLLTSRYKT